MIRYGMNTKELDATISLISRLLGIRVTFFDADGRELEMKSLAKMTAYCEIRRRDKLFNARCVECDRVHLEKAKKSGETRIYHCHEALLEGIIPLCDIGGVYLGSIVFGQIRDKSVRRRNLPAKFARAYSLLPSFSYSKAVEIGTLLKYVSEYIIHSEIVKRRSLPWADRVEACMNSNLSRRISVSELARETGFSASFIQHRFKEDYGVSPAKYMIGIKMKSAHKMLSDGASVKETAETLGFHDQFHFSKAFKRHFGVPPSEIRNSSTSPSRWRS